MRPILNEEWPKREYNEVERRKLSACEFMAGAIKRGLPENSEVPEQVKGLMLGWPGGKSALDFQVALEALRSLGAQCAARGGFWQDLMFAAWLVGLHGLRVELRQEQRRALLRLANSELRDA